MFSRTGLVRIIEQQLAILGYMYRKASVSSEAFEVLGRESDISMETDKMGDFWKRF